MNRTVNRIEFGLDALERKYREMPEVIALIERLRQLGTALNRYGQHDDDCRTINENVPEASCNCGLMNALKGRG